VGIAVLGGDWASKKLGPTPTLIFFFTIKTKGMFGEFTPKKKKEKKFYIRGGGLVQNPQGVR